MRRYYPAKHNIFYDMIWDEDYLCYRLSPNPGIILLPFIVFFAIVLITKLA